MALGSRAHFLYGQGTPAENHVELQPRFKYNFSVSMIHKLASAPTGNTTTLFPKVSSVTMPSYSSKTTTLNQYNKKRVVQSGIDYSPITLIAYDTVNGDFEKFLKDYSEYYYAGSMNYGRTRTDFLDLQAGTKLQSDKNYIEVLKIERYQNLKKGYDFNTIMIYNPTITSIDADTLDYSDSGLVQYRISFVYEGYDITTNDYQSPLQKVNDSDAILEEARRRARQDQALQTVDEQVTSPPEQPSNQFNEDIVDNRETQDPISQIPAQVESNTQSPNRTYDNIGEAFLDDTIEPGETIEAGGTVYQAVPTNIEGEPVRFEPIAAVVDNSAVSNNTVIAQSTDSRGNIVEQVVETTGVDAEGSEYTETKRVPVSPPEYRVYDQYVGMNIDDIPEDKLNLAADSGAYYETDEGTLANYADDPTHDEKMEEFLNPSQGYVSKQTSSTGTGKDYYMAYNPETGYENFNEIEDARAYSGVTQDMVDEGQVMSQSVAPSMTEEQLRSEGSQTQSPTRQVRPEVERRLEEKRARAEKRREEMGEDAYQAMLDRYRPVSQKSGQVDESKVFSQSVAPSMTEEELREQGSMTPMPAPNPDLIAKADSFDSDGDPINNTDDSEE